MSDSQPTGAPPNDIVLNTIINNPELVFNTLMSRAALMQELLDPRRDLNAECGYPDTISVAQYRRMYDRGMGRRVVNVYPEECWKKFPIIFEDSDPSTQTPFEETLDAVDKQHNILYYMQRIDEMSGVGHFGLLFFGLNDGAPMDHPVEGCDTWEEVTGEPNTNKPPERRLLYLRVLDESLVSIAAYETDVTNPRFGRPTYYNVTFADPRNMADGGTQASPDLTQKRVHWSRVVHVADDRKTSEVIGTPRQKAVWDRLYDLCKVLGGSAEMFWRGGFPGISLETQKGLEGATIDTEATREAMYAYMNGLQRYFALTGMSAKSLSPQIADPTASFEVQVKAICIIHGVPFRVFMGIEEGVVSGDQATLAWESRLSNRRGRYITPMLVNPVIQRLIDLGVLAPTAEPHGWTVEWPDTTSPSESTKADITVKKTEALAKYVQGGVDTIVPPLEFLTVFCGFDDETAKNILEAAIEHITAVDAETEIVPGHMPTPPELEQVQMPANGQQPPANGQQQEPGNAGQPKRK